MRKAKPQLGHFSPEERDPALAIRLDGVSKRFGETVAVQPFELSVLKGETLGIIGPDGGGKSTLLRTIATLILPDAGRGAVCGYDLFKEFRQIRRSIGYMPQRFSLYGDLTVFENMRFFADVFGLSRSHFKERVEELLSFNALEPFLDRKAANLSGGMKQKLALSCILIPTPQLVILDEPTTGVDPVSRQEFWQILASLREKGVTVLVTTPYMDEAQQCDRICLLHQGRRLIEDNPERVAQSFPYAVVEVRGQDLLGRLDEIRAFPEVASGTAFGDRLHLYTKDPEALRTRLEHSLKKEKNLLISMGKPSIEDVFVSFIEQNIEEVAHG
ncbi:MAG TPA: ATPase [Cyanobacteria bacterium UBA8530]|nr:ATPase [Cyanobacteria bacterium UBA8530]